MLHIPINNSFEIKPWNACIYVYSFMVYILQKILENVAHNSNLTVYDEELPNILKALCSTLNKFLHI